MNLGSSDKDSGKGAGKERVTKCKSCGVTLVDGKPVNRPARGGGLVIPTWLIVVLVVVAVAFMITPQDKLTALTGSLASGKGQSAAPVPEKPGPVDPNAKLPEGHPPLDGAAPSGDQGGVASGAMPGNIMEQLSELKGRIEKDPKDADALKQLGNMYYEIQRADPAIEYYSKYLEIKPDDPEVHSDIGSMYFEKNDLSSAKEHFNKAIEIDSNLIQPRFNLALVLASEGAYDDAMSTLNQAKALNPSSELQAQIESLEKQIADQKKGAG